MNKKEMKIIIGGAMITAITSASFCMSQGNIAVADDEYKSPIKTIKKYDKVTVVKNDTKLKAEHEEIVKEQLKPTIENEKEIEKDAVEIENKQHTAIKKPVENHEQKIVQKPKNNPTQNQDKNQGKESNENIEKAPIQEPIKDSNQNQNQNESTNETPIETPTQTPDSKPDSPVENNVVQEKVVENIK